MDLGLLGQFVINGLMLGMIYALVAVGFTLFFGVLDVIQFSHGDVLMVGAFAVIPYISPYFVGNVGMTEEQLPLIYIVGGALTLVTSPIIGRWADRYGKLRVYRWIAPLSALMLLIVSHLPPTHAFVAASAVGLLMVFNAGRMIAARVSSGGAVAASVRYSSSTPAASLAGQATSPPTISGPTGCSA